MNSTRSIALASLTLALATWFSARSPADDRPDSPPAVKQAKPGKERASGVILKVERVAADDESASKKKPSRRLKLTINTAAVWRDWARDQAAPPADESPKKAAKEGANSVAAKGEPEDEGSLVTVELPTGAHVETRFRALDDETSKGARNPDKEPRKGRDAKPTRFHHDDLKPGLFVEIDFHRKNDKNVATNLAVIRPEANSEAGKK